MKKTVRNRSFVGVLAVAAAVLVVAANAPATVWNVATLGELNTAMGGLGNGDEVIIAPGTYNLGHGFGVSAPNVTIRGLTGNRDDVVLYGGGMNNQYGVYEGIQLYGDGGTLKDLTLEGFYHHAVHWQPGADYWTVSNVKTLNIGEHHMKAGTGSPDAVVGSIVEGCLLQQTQVRQNGLPNRPDDYLGGLDALGATDWIVRDNVAIDINAATFGLGDPGIFMWQYIDNAVIERNVVINCNKGIGLGNPASTNPSTDCIIRNNFILRGNDIGLELCSAQNAKIYNNTIYSPSAGYFRTVHLYGGNTVNVDSRYNIIRGQIFRNGANWSETGNIVDTVGTVVVPGWFVDAAAGDFHLTASAVAAIDGALTLAEVPDDIDGHSRPVGDFPDVGADEYGSSAGPQLPTPPPAAPPAGVPYLDWAYQYAGDGLYGVTFTVRGNDGVAKSFFADASFQGADGGEIQQMKAFVVVVVDVDSDSDAEMYDGLGDPPYDKNRDSYFLEPFPSNTAGAGIVEDENYYHIEAGTGGGSKYTDAKLAYICTDGNVSYTVLIGRLAVNWPFSGTLVLPPPGDANYDGLVDGGDYTLWADNYGSTGAGWGGADFNGDNVTDGGDYTIWADFYGTGGGAAIPEPATLVLLGVGGVLCLVRRRR